MADDLAEWQTKVDNAAKAKTTADGGEDAAAKAEAKADLESLTNQQARFVETYNTKKAALDEQLLLQEELREDQDL